MSIQSRIEETKKRSKNVWNVVLVILGLGLLYGGVKIAHDFIVFLKNVRKENTKLIVYLEIQNTKTNLVQFKSECSYYLFNVGDENLKFIDDKELHVALLPKDTTNTSPHTNIYQLNPLEQGMYKVSFPDSHRSIAWLDTASIKFMIKAPKGTTLIERVVPFQKKSLKKKYHFEFK